MNALDQDSHWPVICRYTRAQALADGLLVDLTSWAGETGFKVPVACTCALWESCLVCDGWAEAHGQSVRGRAHDLLWMLYLARRRQPASDQVLFQVLFLQSEGGSPKQHCITLKALIGPGDGGQPVVTVMLPDED